MLTPTQAIVAAAHDVQDVTDAAGRVITVQRPNTLDRLHLFKAVGPYLAHNDRYLGIAMLAFAATAIDGVPLPRPTTEQHIDAATRQLGDAGIAAIATALQPPPSEGPADATAGN